MDTLQIKRINFNHLKKCIIILDLKNIHVKCSPFGLALPQNILIHLLPVTNLHKNMMGNTLNNMQLINWVNKVVLRFALG